MACHPFCGFLKGHGAADAEPLGMGEPKLGQHGLFAGCFDPFGNRFQAKPFRHGQNGRTDPLLARVFVNPRHKAAVDLQPAQGKTA